MAFVTSPVRQPKTPNPRSSSSLRAAPHWLWNAPNFVSERATSSTTVSAWSFGRPAPGYPRVSRNQTPGGPLFTHPLQPLSTKLPAPPPIWAKKKRHVRGAPGAALPGSPRNPVRQNHHPEEWTGRSAMRRSGTSLGLMVHTLSFACQAREERMEKEKERTPRV